ncbi:hypothetical protein KIW84_UN0493 [Lathyrus oleraceus]|nr:hypothetical protein KIW84_UN0493 [Pisum sativum]
MNESALDGDGDYEEPKPSLSPQVQPKNKKLLILNLNGFLLRRVYFQEVLEHKLTTHEYPGELIQMNESALDGDGDYEEPKPSLSPQVQPKTKKLLILNLNGFLLRRVVYFQEVLEHKLTTHRISGELIQMNESALDGDECTFKKFLNINSQLTEYPGELIQMNESALDGDECTFKKFLNINSQLTEYPGELIQMNESALDGDECGDYEEPKPSLSPQVQPKTKKLLILNLNGFLLGRVYFQEVLEHKSQLTEYPGELIQMNESALDGDECTFKKFLNINSQLTEYPGELIQMNESALDGDECTFKKFLNINSQLTEYPGELIQMNESALDGDGDYEEPKPSLSPQVQPKTKKLLILNLNGFLLRRVYFQEVLEHKLTTHRISGELIQMNESALDGDGDYEEPKPSLSPQVQPKTKKLLILNLNGFLLAECTFKKFLNIN